ncbi:NAD(P)H dehydrogenase (quinone)s [Striga asiatica]|uniref:NAD(P)H dehydrogenase (Quinone)s n=1 Tax=Striga asiatica TaxID=4170 RepID=A0A5A7P9V4_STRAF|nr:NAD(P)H dehydrogenase (quinone)s [Striga asiatica]
MCSFFSMSSSSVHFRPTPFLSSPHLFTALPNPQFTTTESKLESSSSSSSLESSTSSFVNDDVDDAGITAYKWCAALGGIGFLETAYLTYLKLTDSDAFCPMGGGSCTTILTSAYSSIFGIPLPLFGMVAYGLVATLGLQLDAKNRLFGAKKTVGEIVLIGITTAMAVASAYFLYILRTEFGGELCLYCLASAVLSFSLFFITLKKFGINELQRILGLQLVITGAVVIALTASYNGTESISR